MSGRTDGPTVTDRIEDRRGARTPYGPPHPSWPVRVDTFLEDGIGESDGVREQL